MDKRKVFAAYRRGWITIHECAQILGINSEQFRTMMEGAKPAEEHRALRFEQASLHR